MLAIASPTNLKRGMERFNKRDWLWLEQPPPPTASALEIDAALTLTRPPVIPRVLDRTHMQDFPAADAHC